MAEKPDLPDESARRLRRPVGLTRAGMAAERLVRAFWPAWTVILLSLAALMLGLHETLAVEAVWSGIVAAGAGLAWSLMSGARAFEWPTREEALDRLDTTLPGRPLAALADTQAIGAGDGASEAVWQAHLERMTARAAEAKAVSPDLKLARRDPFALRYVALLFFATALLFGSILKIATVTDVTAGGADGLATGPVWEGWVEPPSYTGRPSLYLNDITAESFAVPEGSQVTLRFYGEVGALTLQETVSGRTGDVPPASDPLQSFEVTSAGEISVVGRGGQRWTIELLPDAAPEIAFDGLLEPTTGGELRQPFEARDDYGVVAGQARLVLNMDRLERTYGLAVEPDPREPIVLDLPMTITGDRADFREVLIEDVAKHAWAGLPVDMELTVEDALGQSGSTDPSPVTLPGRRFFDPLAAAIIEQRRDLLWSRDNALRVSDVLRAVSHRPEELFRSETAYLKLRVALRRLETPARLGYLTTELQEETAEILWEVALEIEEGDLSDALERLRRAQEQLSEAIENGATDEEIAELMEELRQAMQDYMQQLAEQAPEGEQEFSQDFDGQEITGDQLEDMLQRLQELMEQGRMEEAQALLQQLQQMMENMQIARGQQGQGQPSPGQEAMNGLAETLREQQGLSDETFGDLQEQFNPGQQQGQQPGQQGQGQQGQQGQQPGQPGQPGQGQGNQPGGMSLADRQDALRRQLEQQQRGLPGAGTPGGDAAREALDRAGRAMEQAEDALREDDLAGALDNQSDAMDALREGMQELGEAMAQQQGQPGQQGEGFGQAQAQNGRDPLGRETGQNGRVGTDRSLLQGDDIYRRAEELLDEIRRRSADQTRPDEELDYLRRLLDRF